MPGVDPDHGARFAGGRRPHISSSNPVDVEFRPRSSSAPTVVIVATESLIRYGIAAAVKGSFAVVAGVDTISDAMGAIGRHGATLCVAVLDPASGDGDVEAALAELVTRHPRTKVVALFRSIDPHAVLAACRSGVRGFLHTSATASELDEALRRVHTGDVSVHPSMLPILVDSRDARAALSAEQVHTLTLLADGLSSKQIALATGRSVAAVNHFIERSTQRLGATNRTHAVACAFRQGLVT